MINAGTLPADPDATWRALKNGTSSIDPDPSAVTGTGGDKYLGYVKVSVVATSCGREWVLGSALRTANQYEVPRGLELIDRILEQGVMPARVAADKAYTGDGKWLDGLRARNVAPLIDLKKGQASRDPSFAGCLVRQGWPYLPQLPERLWDLTAPPISDKKKNPEAWNDFYKLIAEREQYALPAHGIPGPTSTRVTSPLRRGRGLWCKAVPGSEANWDGKTVPCEGEHLPHEACGLTTATFGAKHSRLGYQPDRWQSAAWRSRYKQRSGVERSFSMLKNPDSMGLASGMFRLRRLEKVTFLSMLADVAANLRLRLLEDREATKSSPPRRTRRAAVMSQAA